MTDYLIVGSGLAGIAFAETALQHNKTIFVIDADVCNSSKVAAGLYNPVVLKRFTALAHAEVHLDQLDVFYGAIEAKLNFKFNFKLPVLRKFASAEEQNDWFAASDKPGLTPFLSTELVHQNYCGIEAPFGYGKVNRTGFVNTTMLVEKYKAWLFQKELLLTEIFDYIQLESHSNFLKYKKITARHIIFAEGFGMHANPFFKNLPLDGAKGELLIIKAPGLTLDVALNASVFILPLGDDMFKIGATYNWTDKTEIPTDTAKQELVERLKEVLTCDYEIVAHYAGVRPTVKDRKPLIGTHSEYPAVHIINGLGTRGVILAPAMAKTLFERIENGTSLPPEIDISRFHKIK